MATQSKKQRIMDHILGTVFELKANSPVHKALEHNMYVSTEDIISAPDETLNELTYPDDKNKKVEIPKNGSGLLITFKQFVIHHNNIGQPFTKDTWENITQDEFDDFQVS